MRISLLEESQCSGSSGGRSLGWHREEGELESREGQSKRLPGVV